MKYLSRPAVFSSMLFIGSLGTAFCQVTTTGIQPAPNYDSFVPPAVGGAYQDPVFGSTIRRVSNAATTPNKDRGGYLTWIQNEYATMSPFNSDNSRFILVHESYFALYDGAGFYLSDLPFEINASSEPRWSRKDNAILYYHWANQLRSYNISTGGIAVVATFSEYSTISGNGEMDISLDGDHFVFAGDNRYVFVYQISTQTKFRAFDTAGHPFDSLYIAPDNNVTITWMQTGTSRFSGIELFDTNLNFQRQVAHAGGHMDVTRDTNGDEVLVWTNSNDAQPLPNCNNGIVKIRLADARQTCLAQLDWSLAVHISAPDGNGTVFVDTEAPSNPTPGGAGWIAYTNEILQVRLDGSGVTRWAHHRSRPVNTYNWQPKLSSSRDGTRLLFASNYDLSAIQGNPSQYSDAYLIVLGTAPAPTTSQSTPTPASSAAPVRFEENNGAVQYTGTWYNNHGAFNSGGSANLAMAAGSPVKFTFTGTGVKWIGYRDAWSGTAQVYLDGILVATIDTFSASASAQAENYSVNNLPSAAHTLTIAPTGQHSSQSRGSWVWVDAFDVTTVGSNATATTPAPTTAPPIVSNPVRIEQNNPAVVYSGGSWYPNAGAFNSSGSAVMAMDPGARATLTFTGKAVSWIGYSDEWAGVAWVYVDGVLLATVDTYASPAKSRAVQYTASGLTSGAHTIAIVAAGAHTAKSAGNWVWVDAFDVTP